MWYTDLAIVNCCMLTYIENIQHFYTIICWKWCRIWSVTSITQLLAHNSNNNNSFLLIIMNNNSNNACNKWAITLSKFILVLHYFIVPYIHCLILFGFVNVFVDFVVKWKWCSHDRVACKAVRRWQDIHFERW